MLHYTMRLFCLSKRILPASLRSPRVFRESGRLLPRNMALKLISCEPLGGELSLRYSVLA